jgi:hypothetical protein
MLHSLALWARLSQKLQEGRMGAVECTTLAFEEECDDLVGAAGGGRGLKCDGGLIILAS